MSGAGTAVGTIVALVAVATVVVALVKAVWIVKEKEAVVIERLGRFKDLLTPGVHLIVPFIDRAKRYSFRYYVTNATNSVQLVTKTKETRISTQVWIGRRARPAPGAPAGLTALTWCRMRCWTFPARPSSREITP